MQAPFIPGTFFCKITRADTFVFRDKFEKSSIQEIWLNTHRDRLEIELRCPFAPTLVELNKYNVNTNATSYKIFDDLVNISNVVKFLIERNTFSKEDEAKLKNFAAATFSNKRNQLTEVETKISKLNKKLETEKDPVKRFKHENKLDGISGTEKILKSEVDGFLALNPSHIIVEP